ncbi:hypothetical protein C1645_877594 [Glomus cerebriforme]|uniref:Uncharacterized protein n=1 Tax=Glomus cerebriforme TaxID=658196 RepID=A0A397SQ58_9GLOM|nr:hypothetical protein C1645_877594 [Glomus cerebriforme]
MSEIQIFLNTEDISNRLYVVALASKTHTFFNIKISSPEEIIRKYKNSLRNAYMIFKLDYNEAFKIAKSEINFRKNSRCFKNFSLIWKIAPKKVKDEYQQVFENYKDLKPINQNFITYNYQENTLIIKNPKVQDYSLNNTNSFTPQPKVIQLENFEVTLDQNNSSNNFFQSEVIRYPLSSDNIDFINNNIEDNIHLDVIQFENSSNNISNLVYQPETVQFEALLGQEYKNNFIPDSVYLTRSLGVFSALSTEGNFYLDQNNLQNNFICRPEDINFEITLDQNNSPNSAIQSNNTNDLSYLDKLDEQALYYRYKNS